MVCERPHGAIVVPAPRAPRRRRLDDADRRARERVRGRYDVLVRADAADRVARVDDLHVGHQKQKAQVVDGVGNIFTVRRDDLRRVREARERRVECRALLRVRRRSHDNLRVQRSAH